MGMGNPFVPKTSEQAKFLVKGLKSRGIKLIQELKEGYKIADIYVPTAKLEIEVDGAHHHEQSDFAYKDLLKTKTTFQKGRRLIRIPNIVLKEKPYETIVQLTEIIKMLEKYHQKFQKTARIPIKRRFYRKRSYW